MRFLWNGRVLASLGVALLLAGCVTTGGDQLTNTVNATYKTVRQLDADLGDTVQQLNTTAADLNQKVSDSDQELRRLQGLVQENQQRLREMQAKLDRLESNLARVHGWTSAPPAPAAPPPGIMPGAGGQTGAATEAGGVEPLDTERADLATQDEPLTGAETAGVTADSAIESYQQAQRAYMGGDYDAALKLYQEYLNRYPTAEHASDAQFWKAQCYLKLGEASKDAALYENAISEFQTLRSGYPSSRKIPYAMHNQAVVYGRLGQTQKAIELFEELIRQYPLSAEAESAKSMVQKLQG
jgi:TolA-binding protein